MSDQHKNSGEEARLARVPGRLRPYAFKPGQSGNPRGRPPGTSLKALIARLGVAEALDRRLARPAKDRQAPALADRVAQTLLNKAIGGHFGSMKQVLDLVEGPPG